MLRRNLDQDTFRIHRLVQAEYRARVENPQEKFEAAVKLLLLRLPNNYANKNNNDQWVLYDRYIPQVLALANHYNESQTKPKPLKPTMDFISLLANAVRSVTPAPPPQPPHGHRPANHTRRAIHDNDTTGAVPVFLDTAEAAYAKCPDDQRDRLTWAFLQSLQCLYHLSSSEFSRAEEEMKECLQTRLELLPPDNLLVALAYSFLSMAIASQGRLEEGLDLVLKAGKILAGPAAEISGPKIFVGFNISRNYYCLGKFQEAEEALSVSLADADGRESWWMQVYGHLAFASLRSRMGQLNDAQRHVEKANHTIEISGTLARFSWLSSFCAYRAGDVAIRQGRVKDAV